MSTGRAMLSEREPNRRAASKMRDLRPLDPFASIKTKLGVLVGSASTVCALAVWWGLHTGLATRYTLPALGAAGPRGHPAPGPRHDLAAAGDDRGRRVDGPRRLQPPGPRHQQRRGRASWPSPSTGWPRTWPRSTASAASSSPTSATSCAHRSPPCERSWRTSSTASASRTRRPCGPRCCRPSAWPAWSSSCWTCPGSRAGRRRCGWRRCGCTEFLAVCRDEAAMSGRPVTFDVQVDPPDLSVVADRERLHQVLANLVDNATRHSPDGGTVWLQAHDDVAGIVLDVIDEGPGIAPEDRARVFERFHRGGQAQQRRRHRPRPGHRPLGRRPARRHDPGRRQPGRLPDPRRPPPSPVGGAGRRHSLTRSAASSAPLTAAPA